MNFLSAIWLTIFITLATSRVTPITNGMKYHDPWADSNSFPIGRNASPLGPRQATPEPENSPAEIWAGAVCRGKNLVRAMKMDDEEQIKQLLGWDHVESVWDGELWPELITWGYDEDEPTDDDDNCDFDEKQGMARAFKDLGINPDPVGPMANGHNQCYKVRHQDGLTVEINDEGVRENMPDQWYTAEGHRYRSTGGFAHVGVNGPDGALYFLERESPEFAARRNWKVQKPQPDELPKLRASSDLAWGYWNRVTDDDSIKKIRYIMSMHIVNIVTSPIIIPRALQHAASPVDSVHEWPGTEFVVNGAVVHPNDSEEVQKEKQQQNDAAYALIGSPNGLGAAYFLLQHKRQLGSSKSIKKIVVFKSDENEDNVFDYPNLLFVVDHNPNSRSEDHDVSMLDDPNRMRPSRVGSARVVRRSRDGKNVLREHKLHLKL